jgi:hypothetical protein
VKGHVRSAHLISDVAARVGRHLRWGCGFVHTVHALADGPGIARICGGPIDVPEAFSQVLRRLFRIDPGGGKAKDQAGRRPIAAGSAAPFTVGSGRPTEGPGSDLHRAAASRIRPTCRRTAHCFHLISAILVKRCRRPFLENILLEGRPRDTHEPGRPWAADGGLRNSQRCKHRGRWRGQRDSRRGGNRPRGCRRWDKPYWRRRQRHGWRRCPLRAWYARRIQPILDIAILVLRGGHDTICPLAILPCEMSIDLRFPPLLVRIHRGPRHLPDLRLRQRR